MRCSGAASGPEMALPARRSSSSSLSPTKAPGKLPSSWLLASASTRSRAKSAKVSGTLPVSALLPRWSCAKWLKRPSW